MKTKILIIFACSLIIAAFAIITHLALRKHPSDYQIYTGHNGTYIYDGTRFVCKAPVQLDSLITNDNGGE